jgi:hypothetical protein
MPVKALPPISANPSPQPTTWAAPPAAPVSPYGGRITPAASPRGLIWEKEADTAPAGTQAAHFTEKVQPAGNQPKPGYPDAAAVPSVQLEPPGSTRIFNLDSEAMLRSRIIEEHKNNGESGIEFPQEPVVSKDTYAGRRWPELRTLVEPSYVCYGRLYFEDKNTERYGWDAGILQPLLSTAMFYGQVALLPYQWASDPFRCCECSAGYCLPGDPVPYLLYPPGLSITGGVAEAVAIVALIAIFP